MSTPVYNQAPTTQNRPMARLDGQGRPIPSSFNDLAFQGDYGMSGNNLIYKGLARPGASSSAAVWQIALLTYDMSNNLTSITWPHDANGKANNDFQFIWDNRSGYTYS